LPSPEWEQMNGLQVYLKQLSIALAEAAASDDPRVHELALRLLERAPRYVPRDRDVDGATKSKSAYVDAGNRHRGDGRPGSGSRGGPRQPSAWTRESIGIRSNAAMLGGAGRHVFAGAALPRAFDCGKETGTRDIVGRSNS